MFTIFLQQILSGKFLLVVIGEKKKKKSNLSFGFKLEPITTYHLWFVIKVFQKYCKRNTSPSL